MNFLQRLFGNKQSGGLNPYSQYDVDLDGLWLHQESLNSFYHHFYHVNNKLHYDTFQVTHANKLGVTLHAISLKWNGKILKATMESRTGFKLSTQLKIRGDLLEGTVSANNNAPNQLALRKLPDEIAEKELVNLKEMGAKLGSDEAN